MAQIGGEYSYQLLNLPNSSITGSLGGINISLNTDDLNLAYYNPSLLNKNSDGSMSLNYINYVSDINFGYASYAQHTKHGTFAYGLHYINHGTFDGADESGIINNTFSANEMVMTAAWGRQIDSSFSVGASFKPIFSFLETYSSIALSTDIGINYQSKDKLNSFSFVIRNLGIPVKNYTHRNFEPLPFELAIGMTKKVKHAPFRLSLTMRHLERWNLRYELDDNTEIWGDSNEKKGYQKVGDEILRHMVLGLEFLPSKNFYVSAGYNHQRRMELGYDQRMSIVGFSFGFGFKVSKFNLSYGMAKYHLASSSHHISISTNLSRFTKTTGATGSNL